MCVLLWNPCCLAAITASSAELLFLFWLQLGSLITEHVSTPVRGCESVPSLPAAHCLTFSVTCTKVPQGRAAFLCVGWHDRGSLKLTRMTTKTTTLGCVLLDLQTLHGNLQPDQSRRWFLLFVVLFTSVTHHHKPKHQMGEKPHKDLSVIHTKPESCRYRAEFRHHREEIWRGFYHADAGSLGC